MLLAVLPPISNRADWIQGVEVRDQTNALVNLAAYTIELQIAEQGTDTTVLTATTTAGTITIPSSGVFQFSFTAAQMGALDPATYDIGCIATDGSGIVTQLIIGTVPVLEGVVR